MLKKCLLLIATFSLFLCLLHLVPQNTTFPYQHEACRIVKTIPIPSERKKYNALVREISRLDEHQETYFYEIYKTVTFFHEIPGFRQKDFLVKQRRLIHSAIAATLLSIQVENQGCPLQFPSERVVSLNGFGFFKERPTPYYEVLCWELAYLLGCGDYIVPTCRGAYKGMETVYQPHVEGRIHRYLFQSSEKFPQRVLEIDLETFCKANAFFILLGHQDLIPFNIPVTKKKIPILWDNESVFPPSNQICVQKGQNRVEFKVPFINVLIDYPQAFSPLNHKKNLSKTFEDWVEKRESLIQYFNHPLNRERLTKEQRDAFFERFDHLTDPTALLTSHTFREFIEKIFPDLFIGSNEARELVTKLVNYPVTDMSALFFIDRYRDWWDSLSEEDHQSLDNWIEKNHIFR